MTRPSSRQPVQAGAKEDGAVAAGVGSQQKKRVAYLGPRGTFSEEAAIRHEPEGFLIPFSTISAVASAVETGMAEEGIVPIENSIEGSVGETLDLLIHESRLCIAKEIVVPIRHSLLGRPGTRPHEVKAVFSHPQALGQCRRFVERCFPKAEVVAALSTAAAVEELMSSERPAAAIANERAAQLYGAEVIARDIQDQSSNATRFVVLAPTDQPPSGRDKTSLCFAVPQADRPGVLCRVLEEFAKREINLTKIESRPAKESLGRYIFLIDLEGHRLDPLVAEALEQMGAKCSLFKVFGSYPRFQA